MPPGPRVERRPADVIGIAVKVMWIATGEIEDTIAEGGKHPAAKALGKKRRATRALRLWPRSVGLRFRGRLQQNGGENSV